MENGCCEHGKKACVSIVPIFNHLESGQMDEVMQEVRSTTFEKGESIYRAGDFADSLHIVHRGRVKIYRLAESGKEQLVRILNPGDFTGELALFQESVYEAFAEAMTESDICIIRREDLQQLLLKYPVIAVKILEEFSDRLGHAERQTTSFATEKTDIRIAHFLIDCMDDKEAHRQTITLPMSKKDLASYLGTTPETLSRRLTELEKSGIIRQEGHEKIHILDAESLLHA